MTSPVSGVIVRWRVTGVFHGTFKLRVLRPAAGGTYTGAGTSAPQTRLGTSTETFPTSLPIQAGDLIGVDSTDPGGGDTFGGATVTGSTIAVWTPPLADGATAAPGGPNPNVEFGFNADVATKPSNTFSFGKLRRNKNTGRAILAVNVPGPGTLSLTGKGVRTQRTGRPQGAASSREVSAGTVRLRIAAKRGKKRKLENTGKVKVGVNVTYTPVGDIVGDPNTRSKRVKLIERD